MDTDERFLIAGEGVAGDQDTSEKLEPGHNELELWVEHSAMARMLLPPPAASRQSLVLSVGSLVWDCGHFGATTVLKTVANFRVPMFRATTRLAEV